MRYIYFISFLCFSQLFFGQTDPKIYSIIDQIDTKRIEADIRTLANFGTRNTFSDTTSNQRGIGAARRWIKSEFDKASQAALTTATDSQPVAFPEIVAFGVVVAK